MLSFCELEHDSDLMYYDGPLLSLYRDRDGDGYLILFVDANEKEMFNTWLVAKPDQGLLEHFQCGSVDLLNALLSSRGFSIFNQNSEQRCYNERSVGLHEVSQWLPEPFLFL